VSDRLCIESETSDKLLERIPKITSRTVMRTFIRIETKTLNDVVSCA
jgi:hypothetical protein